MDDERRPDDGPPAGSVVDWLLSRPDVASRLRRDPPDRVLVLGCGDGSLVEALATTFPNMSVYGIEDEQHLLDVAVARLGHSRVRDRVLCQWGSVWFPRVTATFDVVVAVGLLTGGDDDPASTAELLTTLASVLGEEGLAILDVPDELSVEEAAEAGFGRAELLGRSGRGLPAYLLRL